MKIKILSREQIEADLELSAIAATEEYKLPDGAYGKEVEVIADCAEDCVRRPNK